MFLAICGVMQFGREILYRVLNSLILSRLENRLIESNILVANILKIYVLMIC